MPLKNLDQIRASNALLASRNAKNMRGAEGGEAIKKIPPMVASNGLLAAIAYSLDKKGNGEWQREGFVAIFDAIAKHLQSDEIRILENATSATAMIEELSNSDSQTLKLATADALEWLGSARRFI